MSFIGCTSFNETNTPFLWRTPCSWIINYVPRPSSESHSQRFDRKRWLGVFCHCHRLLNLWTVESIHRLTQHWTQHTQCEVLHPRIHAHTHTRRPGPVSGAAPSSSAAVWKEEHPETGDPSGSASSTEESKSDLISPFRFPCDLVRAEPERPPRGPCSHHLSSTNYISAISFVKKYRFKELFRSTSLISPMLSDQKRGRKL